MFAVPALSLPTSNKCWVCTKFHISLQEQGDKKDNEGNSLPAWELNLKPPHSPFPPLEHLSRIIIIKHVLNINCSNVIDIEAEDTMSRYSSKLLFYLWAQPDVPIIWLRFFHQENSCRDLWISSSSPPHQLSRKYCCPWTVEEISKNPFTHTQVWRTFVFFPAWKGFWRE